ncbi:MAG: hypothetical protein WD342_16250 [Verrucomicrobiales bacterium]
MAIEELGIRYARPEMMALANLLEHPEIKPDRMSGLIAERSIKRSNKDLGRVIAIAELANLDDYGEWLPLWKKALQECFPSSWKKLVSQVGSGRVCSWKVKRTSMKPITPASTACSHPT